MAVNVYLVVTFVIKYLQHNVYGATQDENLILANSNRIVNRRFNGSKKHNAQYALLSHSRNKGALSASTIKT